MRRMPAALGLLLCAAASPVAPPQPIAYLDEKGRMVRHYMP